MNDDPRLLAFSRLLAVIDRLRGKDGCPWDRSQSLEQLAPCLLEEAYEVADAMLCKGRAEVAIELGDLLMNILLIARIAEDAGDFSLLEVADSIRDKLVRRHPHVFGTGEVADVDEVLRNWEDIKREERRGELDESALSGVPVALPALLRAFRVGEKAAKAGFAWPDTSGALAKLDEEIAELKQAIRGGDARRIEEELGDVLFSVVNVGRHVKVEPETALKHITSRFEERFRYLEQHIGKPLKQASLAEMEACWRVAKTALDARAAGIPDGAPEEWRRMLLMLAETRDRLIAGVRDLPPDVAAAQPDPALSEWSVANVLEHLARAEQRTAVGLERAMQRADRAGLPPFPVEGLLAWPVRNRIVRPVGRVAAPDFSAGDWRCDRAQALAALAASRADLLALVPQLVAVNPRALLAPHPVFGDLDVLQWFEFTALHEQVHLGQIERIVKALS